MCIRDSQGEVRVRVVTDNDKSFDRGSDAARLRAAGIALATDQSDAHMHHKFAIVDESLLLTGSYNWTRSAYRENQENILVTEERTVVRSFQETFDALWRRWYSE